MCNLFFHFTKIMAAKGMGLGGRFNTSLRYPAIIYNLLAGICSERANGLETLSSMAFIPGYLFCLFTITRRHYRLVSLSFYRCKTKWL